MPKITKRSVDCLYPRERDYIVWDSELAGFGVRVYPSGKKAFLVQYRAGGRTRRNALSAIGTMTVDEARTYARELLVEVDKGQDPVAELQAQRRVPDVAALCERFMTDYVAFRCKPTTQSEYRRSVDIFIKPALGTFRVNDVKRSDVAQLQHDMNRIPYQANRTLGVLSKMFNLAEVWGLRPDGSNPCRHVMKFPERKRERYLTIEEMQRLGSVLDVAERDGSEPAPVIAAIRLLLLTGARLGEIQTLKWAYVRDGYIALPDSKTGAKRIELGTEAKAALERVKRHPGNPYVIAGTVAGQHWTDLQRPWRRIRGKAQLPDLRIHDLRHSFASLAASEGESLPMIGKLLGHSQVQTTARYAHLAPAPVHATTDRVAASIAKAMNPKPRVPQTANDNEPLTSLAAE